MKMKVFIFLGALFLMSMVSCRKSYDDLLKRDIVVEKMSDLKVSPAFDYQSLKTVEVEVQLPFSVNYTTLNGRLDFYHLDDQFNVVICHSATADHQGFFRGRFEVPAYLEGIYVRNLAGDHYISFSGSLKATLDGGVLNYGSFIDTIPPKEVGGLKSGIPETGRVTPGQTVPLVRRFKSGVINLVQNGDFSINDFGSISSWDAPMSIDGRWHETSNLANKISRVSLASEPVLRFAATNYLDYGGVAQLVAANPGDLITFSADAKSAANNGVSWIYLIPRDQSGQSISFFAREIPVVTNAWTTYTISATMPAGTATCQVLIWNEFYSNRTVYFDNALVIGPSIDEDNDGVINEEDDYPNDPERAYNIFYPDDQQFGTLAFEDNWPQTADYDMNDLVIGYQFKQVLNANTALVELYADFSIRAIGASFQNAFAFEMPVPSWIVQSVTGNSLTEGFITTLANGTEDGQNNAVVFVTDNPRIQLPYPGSGQFINTSAGAPWVEPDTLHLHVTFTSPVAMSVIGYAPYNPFIVINRVRGREVHLVDHSPTGLADLSLFGTGRDDSNPGTGRYYKTAQNLPWALDIPANFDYPVEKSEVIDGFLKFAPWAMTSGAEFSDWYHPNMQGYRNQQYIFAH